MNTAKLIDVIREIGERIEEDKLFLTELDNEIGDGDHGINMARGFKAVDAKLDTVTDKDAGTILRTVGMALVSTVGGAAGPLYGTAFMKAGMAVNGKTELDLNDLVTILDAAIGGVKLRGKATTGEKTMLDAMVPACEALKAAVDAGKDASAALADAVEAARKGVEYTKTIIATKGRASYVGERSIGHQDPGATSFTEMLEVLATEI